MKSKLTYLTQVCFLFVYPELQQILHHEHLYSFLSASAALVAQQGVKMDGMMIPLILSISPLRTSVQNKSQALQ